MEKINDKKYRHIILGAESVSSETAFKDDCVKIEYRYDRDGRTTTVEVLLRKSWATLAQDRALFITRSISESIDLVYNDGIIRIFKAKGEKTNYLITVV